MNANGSVREIKIRCLTFHGIVEVNGEGIPVRYVARCKDPRCCERRDGFASYHYWKLVGSEEEIGTFSTRYLPFRSIGDLPPRTESRSGGARGESFHP